MLHKFLLAERENILSLCAAKLSQGDATRNSLEEMELGLPIFYDELTEVLRADSEDPNKSVDRLSGTVHRESAIRCGKESLRRGYTISQVVHGYGALCQIITQYVHDRSEPINAREFNRLNFCLDIVIADAVTEYSQGQNAATSRAEVQRLGFLAHEMRNALGTAFTAHQLIKKGVVGVGGSTNQILETSLIRMKDIIDRSLSEVRLRGEPIVERRRWRLIDLVGEVETTASLEAESKSVHLHVDVATDLVVEVDRHLVVSAISNLVQNATKFTPNDGNVWIRGVGNEERILIQIEDECGGLPAGKIEELFNPFVQKGENKTGVGLGLSISRRAILLCEGKIFATDLPGKGCIFTIDLPRAVALPEGSESAAIH